MKAMILAAGRGERMRPLTDHTPKPLLMAGGQPLIVHLIRNLVAGGISEIIVNTAHLGHQLSTALGDGDAFGANIRYSHETEALETGGGILKALPMLGDDPFLVINGDIGTNFPLGRLQHQAVDLAHLILVPNPFHHPTGDFGLRQGKALGEGEPRFTFGGIGLYRPSLFEACPQGRFPLAPLLRSAMATGRVSAELYEGLWMDIGTIERLEAFGTLIAESA